MSHNQHEISLPESKCAIAGNVFFKMMNFHARGDCNYGHCHSYDHLTLISAGTFEVHFDGRVGVVKAPSLFLTPKGKAHQFFALSDHSVMTCVHPLRESIECEEIMPADVSMESRVECIDHLTLPHSTPWSRVSMDSSLLACDLDGLPTQNEGRAICKNTAVDMHYLEHYGDRHDLLPREQDTFLFLSYGSISVTEAVADASQIFTAPHILQISSRTRFLITATMPSTVFVQVETFRGELERHDEIPHSITFDESTSRMRQVLTTIQKQTSPASPLDR